MKGKRNKNAEISRRALDILDKLKTEKEGIAAVRILIDAMGGDRAPAAPVGGALRAVKELGVDVTLIGQREAVEPLLAGESGVGVVDAREVITMEDDPSTATRRKKDSSMAVALRMLRDGEGDAVVSAGSKHAI